MEMNLKSMLQNAATSDLYKEVEQSISDLNEKLENFRVKLLNDSKKALNGFSSLASKTRV